MQSPISLIWVDIVDSLVRRKHDAEMLQDPHFISSFWELFYFMNDITTLEPSKIFPRKGPLDSLFHFQGSCFFKNSLVYLLLTSSISRQPIHPDKLGKKVILHHDLVLYLIDYTIQAFSQQWELSSPSLTAKESHKLLSEILEKPYRPKPVVFMLYLLLQAPGIIMHSPTLKNRFISTFRRLSEILFVGDDAVESTSVLLSLMKAGVGPLLHNLEMVFVLWSTLG